MINELCSDCSSYHQDVENLLKKNDVDFIPSPKLVRGLDYYTKTTFEFDHPDLGAQSGIGGGGRYDGLMSSLGGTDLSGIGGTYSIYGAFPTSIGGVEFTNAGPAIATYKVTLAYAYFNYVSGTSNI